MRLLSLFVFCLLFVGALSLLPAAESTSVHVSVDVDHGEAHSSSSQHKRSHLKQLSSHASSMGIFGSDLSVNMTAVMGKSNSGTPLGPFYRVKTHGIVHLIPVHPSTDPFGKDLYKPSGMFKGQYMNIMTTRSVVQLTASQIAARGIPTEAGDTVFANFYHQGQFWVVKVPSSPVQTMIAQADIFMKVLGHAQCRWQMFPNKGLTLYPQNGQSPLDDNVIYDVITSNEAIYEVDPATYTEGSYEPQWGGLWGYYLFGFRLVSAATRQQEILPGPSEQMKVTNLPNSLINKLFGRALQLSNQSGNLKQYNTVGDSCSTTFYRGTIDYTFDHLATAAEKKSLVFQKGIKGDVEDFVFMELPVNPYNIKQNLDARGIEYTQIQNFEDDTILTN